MPLLLQIMVCESGLLPASPVPHHSFPETCFEKHKTKLAFHTFGLLVKQPSYYNIIILQMVNKMVKQHLYILFSLSWTHGSASAFEKISNSYSIICFLVILELNTPLA